MAHLDGLTLIKEKPEHQLIVPSLDIGGGNIDMIYVFFEVAAQKKSHMFLSSTYSSIMAYHGLDFFVESILQIGANFDVNYSIHLDHTIDVDNVIKALVAGFGSVMYDGSQYDFKTNFKETQRLTHVAKSYQASVEAELGVIGGKEDDICSDIELFPNENQIMTFVKESGIDLFAPAIGTIHGFYKGKLNIQWEMINDVLNKVTMPLVLHGGTGLSKVLFKKLSRKGFKKCNFATGLRSAFQDGIKKGFMDNDDTLKPQQYLKYGRDDLKKYVSEIFDLCM